jgi:hypothetical protein
MNTDTSPKAQEEILSEGDPKLESVESVFAPLTRLSQSKSEQTAMQPRKHIIIYLLDHTGCILGSCCLSNATSVIALESFRSYGVFRVKVLCPPHAKLDRYSPEWIRYSTHNSEGEDFRIAGYAQ